MSFQIIWDEHDNLILSDIHWKWHERLINYMLEHYFRPHRFYEALEFHSEPGIEAEYRKYVTHFLRNECSLVVLDEKTNEVHGVALLKWMTKEWRSWTDLRLVVDSPKLNEWITLRRKLIRQYAEENPKAEFDSLHLFEFSITPELRADDEFLVKFFHAIFETARHMGMPRLTFLAMSVDEHAVAEKVQLDELNRLIYSMYIEKGRRPFGAMRGIEELHAILYGKDLAPLIPFYDMSGFEEIKRKEKEEEAANANMYQLLGVLSRSRHSLHSKESKLSRSSRNKSTA